MNICKNQISPSVSRTFWLGDLRTAEATDDVLWTPESLVRVENGVDNRQKRFEAPDIRIKYEQVAVSNNKKSVAVQRGKPNNASQKNTPPVASV